MLSNHTWLRRVRKCGSNNCECLINVKYWLKQQELQNMLDSGFRKGGKHWNFGQVCQIKTRWLFCLFSSLTWNAWVPDHRKGLQRWGPRGEIWAESFVRDKGMGEGVLSSRFHRHMDPSLHQAHISPHPGPALPSFCLALNHIRKFYSEAFCIKVVPFQGPCCILK